MGRNGAPRDSYLYGTHATPIVRFPRIIPGLFAESAIHPTRGVTARKLCGHRQGFDEDVRENRRVFQGDRRLLYCKWLTVRQLTLGLLHRA